MMSIGQSLATWQCRQSPCNSPGLDTGLAVHLQDGHLDKVTIFKRKANCRNSRHKNNKLIGQIVKVEPPVQGLPCQIPSVLAGSCLSHSQRAPGGNINIFILMLSLQHVWSQTGQNVFVQIANCICPMTRARAGSWGCN